MIKNLLTGILLAGSVALYGQTNSGEIYKTISEAYGTKGERINYKNYSEIPWEKVDSNKINIKGLEKILWWRPKISNKKAFTDSVFIEASKLGYPEEEIKNLKANEAVDLAVDIVVNRYEYRNVDDDTTTFVKKYGKNLSNDKYFNLGLGDCDKYLLSFIGVLNLLKAQNKNLANIYATARYTDDHGWNQLFLFTKDSLFLSDIDLTKYDGPRGSLEAIKGIHFDFEAEPKRVAINKNDEYTLNYYFCKELLNQIPDSIDLKTEIDSAKSLVEIYRKVEDEISETRKKIDGLLSLKRLKRKGIKNLIYFDDIYFEQVDRQIKITNSLENLNPRISSIAWEEIYYLNNNGDKDPYEKILKYCKTKKRKTLEEMFYKAWSSRDLSILYDLQKILSNDSNEYWFEDALETDIKYTIYFSKNLKNY